MDAHYTFTHKHSLHIGSMSRRYCFVIEATLCLIQNVVMQRTTQHHSQSHHLSASCHWCNLSATDASETIIPDHLGYYSYWFNNQIEY